MDVKVATTSKVAAQRRRARALALASCQVIGDDYLKAAVEGLAKALGTRWALIARVSLGQRPKATTVAFWSDGSGDNFEYELRGSPCENVIENGACCFPHSLTSSFPRDALLASLHAESYVGVPLRSSEGKILGIMAAFDTKPIEHAELAHECLSLFAGRAAAELERAAHQSVTERLGRIVEGASSEVYVFDGDSYKFQLVNRGARENLGYSMEELKEMTPWDLKPLSSGEFITLVEPLKEGKSTHLNFETTHMRKNGTEYDASVRLEYFGGNDNLFYASITDATDSKIAARREKLLSREVNHRSKNLLALVLVIAKQTQSDSVDDYIEKFQKRVMALSASQDVLLKNFWRDIPLRELVCSQLSFFSHLIDRRIFLRGDHVVMKAATAQNLGLALHELATNSAKYGSLASETGKVTISWWWASTDGDEQIFHFQWVETGGPKVNPPTKRGFGTTVIERSLGYMGAHVETIFDEKGYRCSLSVPANALVDAGKNVGL